MTFPATSSFKQAEDLPKVRVTPKRVVARQVVGMTSVPTSDIEDLEHDLRQISHASEDVAYATLFEEIADKVASFYKG